MMLPVQNWRICLYLNVGCDGDGRRNWSPKSARSRNAIHGRWSVVERIGLIILFDTKSFRMISGYLYDRTFLLILVQISNSLDSWLLSNNFVFDGETNKYELPLWDRCRFWDVILSSDIVFPLRMVENIKCNKLNLFNSFILIFSS